MAKEYKPPPPIRRALIPKRGLHLPFCMECLKTITTQYAMEFENRRREAQRRRQRYAWRVLLVDPEKAGIEEAAETKSPALVPVPLLEDQTQSLDAGIGAERPEHEKSEAEHGTAPRA